MQASSLRRPEPEGSSLMRPAALTYSLAQPPFLRRINCIFSMVPEDLHLQVDMPRPDSGQVHSPQIPAAVDTSAFCKVLGGVLSRLWGFRFLVSPTPPPPTPDLCPFVFSSSEVYVLCHFPEYVDWPSLLWAVFSALVLCRSYQAPNNQISCRRTRDPVAP